MISGKYPIISFEHFIEIALNASRVVGIYPELKNPVFIKEHVNHLILSLLHSNINIHFSIQCSRKIRENDRLVGEMENNLKTYLWRRSSNMATRESTFPIYGGKNPFLYRALLQHH